MPFNGGDCLHLARFLVGEVCGPCALESSQRAAVSRAYYAAYGHAFYHEVDSGRFIPETDPTKKGRDHGRLRNHFRKKGDKTSTKIATELQELHEWRLVCDYEKKIYVSLPITSILSKAEDVVLSLR